MLDLTLLDKRVLDLQKKINLLCIQPFAFFAVDHQHYLSHTTKKTASLTLAKHCLSHPYQALSLSLLPSTTSHSLTKSTASLTHQKHFQALPLSLTPSTALHHFSRPPKSTAVSYEACARVLQRLQGPRGLHRPRFDPHLK